MNKSSLEDEIIPTEFTDKDYDIIAEYIIDKKLGLKSVDELTKHSSCNDVHVERCPIHEDEYLMDNKCQICESTNQTFGSTEENNA